MDAEAVVEMRKRDSERREGLGFKSFSAGSKTESEGVEKWKVLPKGGEMDCGNEMIFQRRAFF